jgi:nitroreductase
MDLFEVIQHRSSIRSFTSEPVSEQEVTTLLEAAIKAPSAGNLQPWRFIVVRDPAFKHKLVDAALGQQFLTEAPVVIVVCADLSVYRTRYPERGVELYCIQDTAAAIENLMLAAVALGLGTCWMGAFDEDQAAQAMNLPKGIRPLAIIPVGHPTSPATARPRKPLQDVVHYESY